MLTDTNFFGCSVVGLSGRVPACGMPDNQEAEKRSEDGVLEDEGACE